METSFGAKPSKQNFGIIPAIIDSTNFSILDGLYKREEIENVVEEKNVPEHDE